MQSLIDHTLVLPPENGNSSESASLREWKEEPAARALEGVTWNGLDEPTEWAGFPLLVGNRLVRYRQVLGFEAWAETGNCEKAAEAAGVSKRSFYLWRQQPWWKLWVQLRQKTRQEDFAEKYFSLDNKLASAASAILDGDVKYSKFSTAVRGMLRDRLEAGVAPIVDRRPQVNIQNNTQNNTIKISDEKLKQVAASNPGALREYLANGVKPPELEG